MEKSYKGYTLKFYSAKENKVWDNRYQINKSRPYDDAEYYGAFSYDKKHWKITFGNKIIAKITDSCKAVIDTIEELNQNIKPKMMYN